MPVATLHDHIKRFDPVSSKVELERIVQFLPKQQMKLYRHLFVKPSLKCKGSILEYYFLALDRRIDNIAEKMMKHYGWTEIGNPDFVSQVII